jgi:hypothetical protein
MMGIDLLGVLAGTVTTWGLLVPAAEDVDPAVCG